MIATAISASSGESRMIGQDRADDVQRALGEARQRREGRLADREQRHAADLLDRPRALEELEQPRHDVDRHAGVAADADRVQQVLVAGAREGDHHAIDAAEGDQVAERVQGPEARDAEPAGLVDVVVDVADGVQPELLVALQALDELQRDRPRAEDQRPFAQVRRPVQADACGGAADPGARPGDDRGGQRSRDRRAGVEQRQQAEDRPRDQQRGDGEPRGVADAAGPGPQVVERVEPADVGEHGPAEADRERDQRKLVEAGAGGDSGEHAGDGTRDDVRRKDLAAQLRVPAAGGRLGGDERLS